MILCRYSGINIPKRFNQFQISVKQKKADMEAEIRDIEVKYENMQESIAKKRKRLVEREVHLRATHLRQEILQERIRELKGEKKMLQKQQAKMKVQLSSIRKEICSKASNFNEEYLLAKRSAAPKPLHTCTYGSAFKITTAHQNAEADNFLPLIEKPELESMEALLFDVDFSSSPAE
nr:uncharacterized protein LOC107449628 [Parasteatoda tepidariorum]